MIDNSVTWLKLPTVDYYIYIYTFIFISPKIAMNMILSHNKLLKLMCHQQQNKWYPQMCLLARFEATLYFSLNEFTCP